MPCALTTNGRGPGGTANRFPSTVMRRFSGVPVLIQSRFVAKRLVSPGASGWFERTTRPVGPPTRTERSDVFRTARRTIDGVPCRVALVTTFGVEGETPTTCCAGGEPPRLHASGAPRPDGAPGTDRRLLHGRDVPGVVLVDVELAVEAEVFGVSAQEALDVGLRRELVEPLLLERAEVLAADLRARLDLRQGDLLPFPGLAKAAADLEHRSASLDRLATSPRGSSGARRSRSRAPP